MGGDRAGLFDLIRLQYPRLSPGYRKIARYILENYRDLAFDTAGCLSQKIGVSESMVVRFANRIGLSGYPEMQRMAQEMIRAELAPADRLVHGDVAEPNSLLERVFEQDRENLAKTLQGCDREVLKQVAEFLVKSRHVWVIGLRESAALAKLLATFLDSVLAGVTPLIHGDAELFEKIRRVEAGDVVIGMSFARYTRRTVEAMEFAKRVGAVVIAITDSLISPAAQVADLTIRAYVDMVSFFNSYTAVVAIINALVAEVVAAAPDKAKEQLVRLEEVLRPYRLWQVPQETVIDRTKGREPLP